MLFLLNNKWQNMPQLMEKYMNCNRNIQTGIKWNVVIVLLRDSFKTIIQA